MQRSLRLAPHLAVPAVLLVLALTLPLPLYLVSLAVFGLPHIVWELGFLRSRYAARWPLHWWLALWVVLLVQALARAAAWLGVYSGEASRIVDMLALFLLVLLVALAPAGTSWLARAAGLALGVAVMWVLEQGDVVAVLLGLAIAHNFTPLAMAWDLAREHRSARGLAWGITGLFGLPVLVALSGWQGALLPSFFAGHAWALDGQLPVAAGVGQRDALWSALVLAQCLHYYCVIVLLPRAQMQRTGRRGISRPVKGVLLLLMLVLLAYYLHDFGGARQLYGVASGAHAWLEWPLLLMALLGARRPDRSARASQQAAGT